MNHFNTKFITCKPLTTLNDLFEWSSNEHVKWNETAHLSRDINCRRFKVEKLKNVYKQQNENTNRRMMVCHDMNNNYSEDRYMQGVTNVSNGFRFLDWNLIDYFSKLNIHFKYKFLNNIALINIFLHQFTLVTILSQYHPSRG